MRDSHRTIVSRRGRPAKAPLSRDVIVAKALDLLAREGSSGLSLRRVASELDTGAASLYVYLANLNELYVMMLDAALADMPSVTALAEGSWRDRLTGYLTSYRHVLKDRKGLAHLAMTTVATGPHSLVVWEVLLNLLREGGVNEAALVAGVDMLLLHVTASAAEEANRSANNQDFAHVSNALANASSDELPMLTMLFRRGMFSEEEDEDRFQWALDVIIDGIVSRHQQSHL